MHRTLAETIDSFSRGIERSKRPEDRKLAKDYLVRDAEKARRLLREVYVDEPSIQKILDET
jgi:hypothetical protein